jgi:hypothetical protein
MASGQRRQPKEQQQVTVCICIQGHTVAVVRHVMPRQAVCIIAGRGLPLRTRTHICAGTSIDYLMLAGCGV